jgi:hypothetical protein
MPTAAAQATGDYLCFLDADDVMAPGRVAAQLAAARRYPTALVCHWLPCVWRYRRHSSHSPWETMAFSSDASRNCCRYLHTHPYATRQTGPVRQRPRPRQVGCAWQRLPRNGTEHYAAWANTLPARQMLLQQFRETTLQVPLHRAAPPLSRVEPYSVALFLKRQRA